jgi:hypothetical protein
VSRPWWSRDLREPVHQAGLLAEVLDLPDLAELLAAGRNEGGGMRVLIRILGAIAVVCGAAMGYMGLAMATGGWRLSGAPHDVEGLAACVLVMTAALFVTVGGVALWKDGNL